LNERRSEFTLNSHKAKVNKILSCPRSRAFFSVSDDGYLKYWPLNKRKQMDDDSFASFRKFHDFSEEDQDSEYFSLLNPDYQNYSGYLGTICKLKDKNYSCIGRDGLTLLISFYSFTALHILAYLGESNGLKELKSQKSVPLIANSFGNSPLFFSINRNHQKTTDRLLKLIIRSQKHLKIFLTSLHGIRNNLCMIIQNSSKYLAPLFHSFGRMKNDFKGLDLSGVKPKFSYFSSLSFENYGYGKEKSPDKRVKVFFSRIRTQLLLPLTKASNGCSL
jgi:WD40 repeat protein